LIGAPGDNVGVTYSPVKIVDFSLVYKRDSIENGALATSKSACSVSSGSKTADT
jgi:hypothetical protein